MEDKRTKMNLDPQWVTGFVDGEGCFHISVLKQENMHLKKQVLPEFTLVQHERNIKVLYALKSYFKCGVVRINHEDRWAYRVRGQSNLSSIIVPFFEKHELKTTKRLDFAIFRDVIQMMGKGEHLTLQGLETIEKCADRINRKGIAASPCEAMPSKHHFIS